MVFTGAGGAPPIYYTDAFPDPILPNLQTASIIGGGTNLAHAAYSPTLGKLVSSAQAHPSYFGIQSTDDGVTWTRVGTVATPPRGPVVWCPAPWNIFVAIQTPSLVSLGYTDVWYYSSDGINWTVGGPAPLGHSWVEYINGVVVAGGLNNAPMLYMQLSRIAGEGPGALSFVASDSVVVQWLHRANNGSRIVIGANTTTLQNRQYSDNGINWFNSTNTARQVMAMAWDGRSFCCSETLSGTVQVGKSEDGINWTFEARGSSSNLAPVPNSAIGVGTASDGNLYMLAPVGTSQMCYSPIRPAAANIFTFGQTIDSHKTKGFAYSASLNRFVSVGVNDSSQGRIASSTGLLGAYTDRTVTAQSWAHIARGATHFVVIKDIGAFLHGWAVSPDGITWTTLTSGIPARSYSGLCYGNGTFLAVDLSTSNIIINTDFGVSTGNDWTDIIVPFGGGATDCEFLDGKFWVLRSDEIWSATDPLGTWTRVLLTTGGGRPFRGIAHGNGKFVALHSGLPNDVADSPDGINWTLRATTGRAPNRLPAFGNGVFVAFDSAGVSPAILKSVDGITWTQSTHPSLTSQFPADVLYINGTFVVAVYFSSGSQGRIYYSGA